MNFDELYNQMLSSMQSDGIEHKGEKDQKFASQFHSMDVILTFNDEELKSWNLTDDLQNDGIALLNYTNSSIDLDFRFVLMSKHVVSKFDGNLFLQELIKRFNNESDAFLSEYSVEVEIGSFNNDLEFRFVNCAIMIIMGVTGLIVNAKGSAKRVVKFTRSTQSVWFVFTAAMMLLSEVTFSLMYHPSYSHVIGAKWHNTLNVLQILASLLAKVSMTASKFHVTILYLFNCVMLFFPFMFRRHRKRFGRCMVYAVTGQWIATFGVSMIWSMVFVYGAGTDCSINVKQNAYYLVYFFLGQACLGYIASLSLSLVFLSKYILDRKKLASGSKTTQNGREMRKIGVKCMVEILFDAVVFIYVVVSIIYAMHHRSLCFCNNCFSLDFTAFEGIDYANFFEQSKTACTTVMKMSAVNSGLSDCSVHVLVIQLIIQEAIFFIDELGYDTKILQWFKQLRKGSGSVEPAIQE